MHVPSLDPFAARQDTPNIGHFSRKDTCFDYGVLILLCIHVHLCIKANFHGLLYTAVVL